MSDIQLLNWLIYAPILGKTMRYSVPHCGQLTAPPLLPFCFSSSQRCRQFWWIHLVQPLHRQGLTHSATRSSRSVAKHTQQCLHVKYRQGYSGKSKWVSTHGVNCCQNKTQRKDSFDTNRQKKIIVVTTTYTNEATFPCSLPLPLKIMLFTLLYIKQPYYNFLRILCLGVDSFLRKGSVTSYFSGGSSAQAILCQLGCLRWHMSQSAQEALFVWGEETNS